MLFLTFEITKLKYSSCLRPCKANSLFLAIPQFVTPNVVYAILSNDLRIQIKAGDSTGKNMTYLLMSNGTFTNSRITKQGVLTIPALNESGTVYIQVEDEKGTRNILILQVKAMECPCKNNGKCYQNESIVYAVKTSDYFCECEKPYTGKMCEIGPNLCDEEPCYPGLKCSAAQNSDGFTCEKCPPSFEGDGKNCKLSTTQGWFFNVLAFPTCKNC